MPWHSIRMGEMSQVHLWNQDSYRHGSETTTGNNQKDTQTIKTGANKMDI